MAPKARGIGPSCNQETSRHPWFRFILNPLHRLFSGLFNLLSSSTASGKDDVNPNKHISTALYQTLREGKGDNNVQEIRLLSIHTVHGRQTSGPQISCTLRTSSVAAAQQNGYFALSYVWGDVQNTIPIVVNGLTFLATRNLVEALRHVSEVEPECCSGLWVDAVCINQIDAREKSSQVALMGDIYAGARGTLAWLGAGDPSSHAAIRLLNCIWNDDDVMGRGGKELKPERLAVPEVCDLLDGLDSSLYQSDVFDQRPYWYRIWTVQEAVLGKSCRLIAGTDSCYLRATIEVIDWAMSDAVLDFLKSNLDPDNAALQSVHCIVRGVREDAERGRPLRLLHGIKSMVHRTGAGQYYSDMTRTMVCLSLIAFRDATDARDMIFGLCGLFDFGVEVDYSVSAKDLYTRVAGLMATQIEDATQLLQLAGLSSQTSTLALPSWVPDWSITPDLRPVHSSLPPSPVPLPYRPVVSGETLQIRGVCLGVVESTSDLGICPGMVDENSWGINRSVEECCGRVLAAAEYLAGGNAEDIVDKIASQLHATYRHKYDKPVITTLLDLLADLDEPNASKTRHLVSLLHCFVLSGGISLDPADRGATGLSSMATDPGDRILSSVFDGDRDEALDRKGLLREAAYQFQRPHFNNSLLGTTVCIDDYKFFRTGNGRPGYSVKGIKAGDVVYMVGGCRDLLILRPAGSHFTFLAPGCVVGFGGDYPIDWNNPPGEVEAIDIM